jgi:uncharacterized protein (TIGR00251 family)
MLDVDRDGNILLSVHVQPGARTSEVVGRHGDALKLRVAAPPEDGKANRAVVALVAQTLGVGAGDVELVSGASSRRKRIKVTGLSLDVVSACLATWLDPPG